MAEVDIGASGRAFVPSGSDPTVPTVPASIPDADWVSASDLTGVDWPLAGYAPGGYMGTCGTCRRKMMGCAKRSRQCLACAITELRDDFEAIDSAFRIKVWNEAKGRGLSDRAAMDEIVRQRSALTAQGIEARQGRDAQRLDPQDESPVACDAPSPDQETNHDAT